MELYLHKNRNVVVKSGEDGDKWLVKYVGVSEAVAGNKRRGRHPDYSKAMKSTEFVALESPSNDWIEAANAALTAQDAPEVASVATDGDTASN